MPDDENKPDPATDDGKPDTDKLGDGGKKALDAERKARRDAEKKANDLETRLKEIEDKDKSEVERLTSKVAELEKGLGAATADRDRFKVALDKKLTLTQAKRLVGDTEDDLAADADELLADLGATSKAERKPGDKPAEDLRPGNGNPGEGVDETDPAKLAEFIPRP